MRVINDTMNWVRVRTGADVHDGSFRGGTGVRKADVYVGGANVLRSLNAPSIVTAHTTRMRT